MKKKIWIWCLLFSLTACGMSEKNGDTSGEDTVEQYSLESENSESSDEMNTEMPQDETAVNSEKEIDGTIAEETDSIVEMEGGILDAEGFVDSINVGWNLGDALGSSAKNSGYDANPNLETAWGNPVVTKELIDYVSSLGFNTIRIPVSWCYNCGRDEEGHLVIGEQWLGRVHEVVDYVVSNDLNIILNSMCDSYVLFRCGVEDEAEWEQIQQDAGDLWRQIAESFIEYDEHLAFEAYNELDNAVQGWTYSELAVQQMNTLNQIFVDSVRGTGGNNETRILIVPTLFDSTKTNMLDAFVLPSDSAVNGLVVTVHSYEEEFDQDIEWIFQSLEDFSDRVGAPVLIGEFGARDDYQLLQWREKFTSNYVARAAEHGIKCCVWDDGYHWKIIDRYDFEKTNLKLVNALLDGVNGVKYETDASKKLVFDNMSYFHFGGMDLKTGIVTPVDYVNKYWAALTTKTSDGSRLKLNGGNKIAITMIAKNQAVNFWIYGITFFDENDNAISYTVGKNVAHKYLCTDIPAGAVTFAVNTYDPYSNHTIEEIEGYFERGDLQMIITFLDETNENQLYMAE